MRRKILLTVLSILSISIGACSSNVVSSNKTSSNEESSNDLVSASEESSSLLLSSSNEESSSSAFVPDIPTREEGVSLETFQEEVNKIEPITSLRPFRITYQIVETVIGTYPIFQRNSSGLLEEGVYNSTLVIESIDGSQNKIKVVGDRPSTTNNASNYAEGMTLSVSGWLSYQAQRRRFLESAQEGEGFKETFYLNPLTMWMVSWGNRPANATVDGTFFAYDEFERTYGADGYCRTINDRDYRYMDGVISSWGKQPKEYHGSYELIVNGTVEYLDEE